MGDLYTWLFSWFYIFYFTSYHCFYKIKKSSHSNTIPNYELKVDKCFEWLHHRVKACFQLLVMCTVYSPWGADQPGCAPISEAGSLIFIIIFMQAANQFAFQLKSRSEHYAVFGILFSSDMVEFWICMHWGVEALPITNQRCRVKELWHFHCGDSIKNSTKQWATIVIVLLLWEECTFE